MAYLRKNDLASQTAIQKELKDEQGIPFKVTKRGIDRGTYLKLINVDRAGNGTKATHHLTSLADEMYPADAPEAGEGEQAANSLAVNGSSKENHPTDSPIQTDS